MESMLPSFVLAYHGCDASVAEGVVSRKTSHLAISQNPYDWLGEGIYFWEGSPARALEYAQLRASQPARKNAIRTPAVVGAGIDLGNCLNLLDSQYFPLLQAAYVTLKETLVAAGLPLPQNRPLRGSHELLLRDLDCAVINTLHTVRARNNLPPFDSVRAAFLEGRPLYEGGSFLDKNHIQLCIRTPSSVKGYFHPVMN